MTDTAEQFIEKGEKYAAQLKSTKEAAVKSTRRNLELIRDFYWHKGNNRNLKLILEMIENLDSLKSFDGERINEDFN